MNSTLESLVWGSAIVAFLTIAYKSYTSDEIFPSHEEILEAVERGASAAVEAATVVAEDAKGAELN